MDWFQCDKAFHDLWAYFDSSKGLIPPPHTHTHTQKKEQEHVVDTKTT